MRFSLATLFLLAVSPLLVVAAPATEVSSLAVRALDGKLEDLTPDELYDHFNGLNDSDAKDLAKKLADRGQLSALLDKIKDHAKIKELTEKLNVSQLLNH